MTFSNTRTPWENRSRRLAIATGRTVLLGSVAGACLAITPAAADPTAIIEQWVSSAAESDVMAVTVDGIDHDAATGRTVVTGLTVSVSLQDMVRAIAAMIDVPADEAEIDGAIGYTLRFPAISFTDLARSDGYFTAASVEADAVLIDAEIEVPDAEIADTNAVYQGFRATDLTWAQVPVVEPDPDRPVSQLLPLLRAVTDVSFSEMSIDEVITRSALPDGGGEIIQRIDALRFSDADRGDIAEMSAQSFATNATDAETGEPFTIVSGPISASDYNYGTMIDVLFGAVEESDFVSAIGTMELSDLRVSVPGEGFSMGIDRIAASDVGVRTPSQALLPYIDALVVAGRDDPDFEPDPEELIRFIGGLYGALRLGEFEMAGMTIDAADEFDGTMDAYGLRDLSAEGLGSFYIRGIGFRGVDDEIIRYDEFEIADIGFPDLDALIELGVLAEEGDPPVDVILAALPTVGRIVNSGIRISIPDDDAEFALDGSVFEMSDHIGPIPTRLALTMDRLQVNAADLDGDARQALEGLGYDTLVLSADILARWEEATSDLRLEIETELADGGRLTLDGVIGNVSRLIFDQPDETAAMALLGATFKQLDARFDDDSLVERGVAFGAEEQDITPEAMRAQLLALVPIALGQLGDAELAAEANQAVSQLIENGTPIALSVVAPAPLPLVAMGMSMQGNPASILGALEIEIDNP